MHRAAWLVGFSMGVLPVVVVEQPVLAQTQIVTDVRVETNQQGTRIILETPTGELPQTFRTTYGKTLAIDLTNTRLGLPEDFQIENPSADIAEITVTQGYANTVRVLITGTEAVPNAELVSGAGDIIVQVASDEIPTATDTTPPPSEEEEFDVDEEIELVVIAEEENDYYVPDASTALGIEAPLLDTPLSIDVVPQEVIEDRNVTELGAALETVGGVVSAGGRGTSVFGPGFLIRGFEVTDSIFRDGIPYFTLAPLSTEDIARVEVLKGPASVLFGQGEPGGVINLISKKPLSEPFYEASITVGSFDTYRGTLDLSETLNEDATLRYRLNLSYENYGSFRNFVDGEHLLISPIVTWEIGEQTTLDFYGQYSYDRETIDEGIPFSEATGIVDVPRDRFFGEDFGEFSQNQYQIGYRFQHKIEENLTLKHALQYLHYEPERFAPLLDFFDPDTGQLDRLEYFAGGQYDRFFTNAELVAAFDTGSVGHQVLFGVEYRHDAENPSFQFDNLFTPIDVFNPVYDNNPYAVDPQFFRDDTVDTISVYLQDLIDFSPQFKAIAGVRFDRADQFRTEQFVGEERTEFEQIDTAFSPRFGLVYKPTEAISLYGSYTSSFNPPFGTSRDPDNNVFEPETGRQFEIGVKAALLDQLNLTLAAFDLSKENIVVFTDTFDSIQIGSVSSQGIELNLQGEIQPGWNITAAYAYLDNSITEDDDPSIVGNQNINVPDNQFSLWTTYEIQEGDLKGLGFGLGLFYVGDRAANRENTVDLPSYFRTDLAIFYEQNNWKAQLNIENLFDTEYFTSSNGFVSAIPGAPLSIFGTIAVEF